GPRGRPDRGLPRCREGGVAHHHLDLVSFAELADPVREALDDGRLPLLQASHIDLDRPRLDPTFGRLLQGVHNARGVDQRLARDAAIIQTFAAEFVPFHQDNSFPELRRPDRGAIAATVPRAAMRGVSSRRRGTSSRTVEALIRPIWRVLPSPPA